MAAHHSRDEGAVKVGSLPHRVPAILSIPACLPSTRMTRCSPLLAILLAPALAAAGPPTFERDVAPILARHGCNAGACHGKARGQNGFALSLLGFDPDFDYAAITAEGKGRRVFPAAPDSSLLLRKASGQVPHGGGKKLAVTDPAYDVLRRWIVAGCPRTPADAPRVVRITVDPAERLLGFKQQQQLRVTAH